MSNTVHAFLPERDFTVRLSSLGMMKIKGPDAQRFLQGQITQDVMQIGIDEHRLSGCCNAQGRLRGLFRLMHFDDALYLLMPKETLPRLMTELKKYAAFFKTEMTDVSEDWCIYGRYQLAESTANNKISRQDTVLEVPVSAHRALLLSISELPTTPTFTEQHWQVLDIQAKQPEIYADSFEKLLPHQIGLEQLDGISFNKGCYTGQEIIARMEYRGKRKTKVVVAVCLASSDYPPGSAVMNREQCVGELIRASQLENRLYLLLCVNDSADLATLTLDSVSGPILTVFP